MSSDLPHLALAIRQPWCWAILFAGKDIENRSIAAVRHGLGKPGRYAIHASQSMTRQEYEDAREFMIGLGVECPFPSMLPLGGIVGSVLVADCVARSSSRWFTGQRGLVLRNPLACDFIPARGELGYFRWVADYKRHVPTPTTWMRRWEREQSSGGIIVPTESAADLFAKAIR